jgi:lysophospholipase L1-like esterase
VHTSRWSGVVSLAMSAAIVLAMAGCETGGGGGGGGGGLGDIGDNNPNVYVAIGDSITYGENGGGDPYPPRLAAMTGKTVVNRAENGETTRSALGRLAGILVGDRPAAVLIDLGAVDLIESTGMDSAVENLRSIIRQCKANKSVPVISTLTPMSGSHELWEGGAIELSSRIRSLASSEGARLVDLEKEFGRGEGLILPDGLHPNDAGNQLMAEAFRDQL